MIDIRHLRTGLAVCAVLLVSSLFMPSTAEAQGGRIRILVANLKPEDETDEDFGEDLSDELRDLLDLDTHVAMSGRDTDDAAREFDLRLDGLDCLLAQQLATLIEVQLVFCGTYRTEGDLIRYSGSFVTVPGGEQFTPEPATAPENEAEQAAEGFAAFFDATRDRLQQLSFCQVDFSSQNWEGVLQYCARAVELAPDSRESRTALAGAHLELEQYPQALLHFEILVEQDPFSSTALQAAGLVALQLQELEKAREYLGRYLELNPSDVGARLQIAADLVEQGDDRGAVDLMAAGFEHSPDNIELRLQHGNNAFRAALELQARQPQPAGGEPPTLTPEVADLLQEALASLEVALAALGVDMEPQGVVNMMRGYLQLDDATEAAGLGERGLILFPDNAAILNELSVSYQRAGMLDESVAAITRALEIQPDLPRARVRTATYLLEAGRPDDAVQWIQQAAQAQEVPADELATTLFFHGYTEGVERGNSAMGIRLFTAAKGLSDVSPAVLSQLNLFHALALFTPPNEFLRENQTVEACDEHQAALDEAAELFPQGQLYGDQQGMDVEQLILATAAFQEMCAVIREQAQRG